MKEKNNRCKHGLLKGTCAICSGLVKPSGQLHYEWIEFCDTLYQKTFRNTKIPPDKDIWFKNHRYSIVTKFTKKFKQKPPYPKWPER